MMVHRSVHDDLKLLATVSIHLGRNPAVVQGGGGNTSIKTSRGMWVKASGFFLRDVASDRGFVAVDDGKIRAGLPACRSEDDYCLLLSRSLHPESIGRPSMETGFHALLGRVVLHSHPVSVNLLCCSMEGREIASDLFPEALWIPWATPGLNLTKKILSEINKKNTEVILLQNHGLIITGDTPEEARRRHDACCLAVARHFQIEENELLREGEGEADNGGVLFPDQAVYLYNASLCKSEAGQQTLRACASLHILMRENGLTPQYLPIEEAMGLTLMEAEKFRQHVAGATV